MNIQVMRMNIQIMIMNIQGTTQEHSYIVALHTYTIFDALRWHQVMK